MAWIAITGLMVTCAWLGKWAIEDERNLRALERRVAELEQRPGPMWPEDREG